MRMKFFHLSDLHIGKHLHFYNMAEEQRYILNQIVERAVEYRPDAILIAGDIYDKSMPSGEAYEIFDEFLNKLADIEPTIPVLIISGNHDNAQRLDFASAFLEKHQIYIAAKAPQSNDEYLKKVVLNDEYGEITFYLFPFIKPGHVRHMFEDGQVTNYETAYAAMLERENIDYSKRNVLVGHQFFVSESEKPQTCDSEQMNIVVGGLDAIDVSVVEAFDYVALGHIHGPQKIKSEKIRYCGTPLKYSVSEEHHNKTITLVIMGEKGTEPAIEKIPLEARRDVRRIKGTFDEIIENAKTEGGREDYVSITLTDDAELYRPKDALEEVYPHILEIMVDNKRTRAIYDGLDDSIDPQKIITPLEAFREFYQLMKSQPMSESEENIISDIITQINE